MNDRLRAIKRADLLSLSGAAVAGAAVGAWLSEAIRPIGLFVLAAGLVAHAFGMTARHRLDRQSGPLPAVWQMLYIVCWIALAVVTVIGAWLWSGSSS